MHYHDLGFWGNDAEAAERNLNQVAAMTKLLEWIRGESHPVSDNAKKKFENVMQRVGEEIEMELPEEVKWKRYAENIDRIICFWEESYKKLDLIKDQDFKRDLIRRKELLVNNVSSLTEDWATLKRSIILPAYQKVDEYIVVNRDDKEGITYAKRQGYRELVGGRKQ